MKRALAPALCALLVPMIAGADWRERLTPPRPGAFPPPAPLEARYRFGWGALTAAEGTFEVSRPQRGQLQLQMSAKTVGAVRGLWRMEAKHTAICDAVTLRPIELQQAESYRDETLKTEARFAPEGVQRKQERMPADDAPAKEKRFKCPDLFDLHTALFFVRSQPLRRDNVYRIVVYPAKAPYLSTVRVAGMERIKVAGREFAAIKLELELQRVTKKLQLEAHQKFKHATAWISDDRDRLLLKIKSEVFVGSVWAELEAVTFRTPPPRTTAR